LNVGEPTLFVQAAYGVTASPGIQLTAAAQPLEEMEGTQLELVFTPDEYGHHHLEILLSISERESGPYRPLAVSPVRLEVGRLFRADAAIVDIGRGELREAEWVDEMEGDDWRPMRLEWADSSVVTAFQTRHAAPESAFDDSPTPTPVREQVSSLAAERQARARAARVEARRSAELHRQRQEREQDEHQQRSRSRMQDWAQAELWGRHERDQVRREERLKGLLEWASTHGIRFTDVPQPVSDEWLRWAEAQVMERVKSDCE
jgi:hypothetical protein